jgi:hypothetical protein
MDSENMKLKTLTDRRFGSIILLFRLAGVPFRIKRMSIFYAIYMRTVIICATTTYLGFYVDAYLHWDDLGRAMTTVRVLIPVTNLMWLVAYCRYVRTPIITVTATKVVITYIITASAMMKANTSILHKIPCQINAVYL